MGLSGCVAVEVLVPSHPTSAFSNADSLDPLKGGGSMAQGVVSGCPDLLG